MDDLGNNRRAGPSGHAPRSEKIGFDARPSRQGPRKRLGIGLLGLIILSLLLVAIPVYWFSVSSDGTATRGSAQAQTQLQSKQVASRISGMSASASNTGTTVTIRLDRNTDYRLFTLAQPSPRLVIDLPRVTFSVAGSQDGSVRGAGLVSQLRFAQKSATESRVVIDLTGPVRVANQEIVSVLGGRALKLQLVPTSAQAFAQNPPPPKAPVAATSLPVPAPLKQGQAGRRFVIVIDPGHGGRDPGALSLDGQLREKDVTLQSAIALRDYLRRDRRFEVFLTRQSDETLALERRIIIARDRRADLFISLHADAAPPTARVNGATVYTLSEEGGQRARRLLNNDNWAIAPSNKTQDASVLDILRDLTQRDTKNQSAIFGQILIDQIRRVGPVTQTSHRRAGFFVLLSPRVPAVLLEMGFMTNPEDAARLADPAFRSRQMSSAARAISAYFDRVQVVTGSGAAQR
jgi:N-acetylmuramoyl-L-alanine amidase